jgi:hypothetical protein
MKAKLPVTREQFGPADNCSAGPASNHETICRPPSEPRSSGNMGICQVVATEVPMAFRSEPLIFATNRLLTLTNVTLAFASEYAVVIANDSGMVTSRVARLEVDITFRKITSGFIAT